MPLSRYQPRKKEITHSAIVALSNSRGGAGRGGARWRGERREKGGREGLVGEGVFLVTSSQGGHECPESVGNVGVQGPPGGHRGSGLGITHIVCAVDRQALQVAAGLGCRGLVRREVVGCRERRKTEC